MNTKEVLNNRGVLIQKHYHYDDGIILKRKMSIGAKQLETEANQFQDAHLIK